MSQFTRTALHRTRLACTPANRRYASILATTTPHHQPPTTTTIPPLASSTTHSPTPNHSNKKPYSFQHQGPRPDAPQALDSLQFILGQKPLEAPVSTKSRGTNEVRTAAEARARARQQLEELHMVVQNASNVMNALSKASEKYLEPNNTTRKQQIAAKNRESNKADSEQSGMMEHVSTKIVKMQTPSAGAQGAAGVVAAVGSRAAGSAAEQQQLKLARILLAVVLSGGSLGLFVNQAMGL
ncbi:hypothetical protein FBU59_002321 [Linderina macrospora]|uniref:Uncharacterized protein n=1 Tax=Linderina macrospora TaxID=4868 RepID=A0ACC1JBB6_9FUNG|nr:hypothetical protein FBU59_002321 [Linderina macrospora]